MEFICAAGEAKSEAYEALAAARRGEYEKAEANLKSANSRLNAVHQTHAGLLFSSGGTDQPVSLIMVHSQDHFMGALSQIELITEMIEMQKELNEVKKLCK